MKISFVLGLLLVLVVLLSSLNLFYVPSGSGNVISGGPSMLVVVAKEDYVFARVELSIQPYLVGNQRMSITFPNGTVRPIIAATKIDIVLPNTLYYTLRSVSSGAPSCISTGIAEPGCIKVLATTEAQTCYATPSQPLCVSVLSVESPTSSYATTSVPIDGIHAFQYLINGTGAVDVQTRAWGVSL